MSAAGLAASRVAAVAILLGGCVSPSPLDPKVASWLSDGATAVPDDRETEFAREADRYVARLGEAPGFVRLPSLDALYEEILGRILPPLQQGAPKLRVVTLRSVDRNAVALANGTIVVSAGLLSVLEDESQLAALLAHEVTHVIRRHALVAELFAEQSRSTVDRMRLSRDLEREADLEGLRRLEVSGYAPSGAARMLRFLEPADRAAPRVKAWDSHDEIETRARRLEQRTADATETTGRVGAERYEAALEGLLLTVAELELDAGELTRADATCDRILRRRPEHARAHFLKAEVARSLYPEGRNSRAARNAYETALALDPDDPRTLRAVGLMLREAGDLEGSRTHLRRYLELAPAAVDRLLIERYLGE